MHGADWFARGVLAMHAWHRLKERPFGSVFVPLEISIDPNPVHLAAARNLFLADNRNVVLRLTGNHARVATHATVQVDRHPPRITVALILVIEILIEREVVQLLLLLLEFLAQTIFLF